MQTMVDGLAMKLSEDWVDTCEHANTQGQASRRNENRLKLQSPFKNKERPKTTRYCSIQVGIL